MAILGALSAWTRGHSGPETARAAGPSPTLTETHDDTDGRALGTGLAARCPRWWAGHPAVGAAVIYALLATIFVGQGLLPGRALSSSDGLYTTAPWAASVPDGVRPYGANFELADAVAVFQPFFEHLRAGGLSVPLWNAHIMGGRPFLADGQSAFFSPFTWPIFVFGTWTSLAVIAILKVFVAGFGTYLLGRVLGMRFGGALLAGIVFAFGTFFVVWLAWPLTNIFPLIPWLLVMCELLIRRPGPLPVCGLAVLTALQFFGGHPETSFHVIVVTILWFCFRAALAWQRGGRRRRDLTRPALRFALALAGGTALAAVALVPLVELLVLSGDWSRRAAAEPTHSDPRYLGALLLFDYWGRPTQTAVAGFVSNRGYYAGALTLMLAAIALIVRVSATRLAVAAFGLLAVLVAVGAQPFFALLTKLPGFNTAHNGRVVIFMLLALALLAGWGLDELCEQRRPTRSRRRLALGVAAAIAVAPVVWMLVAGSLAPSRLPQALKVAWGFVDQPLLAAGESADNPGSNVATIRLSALLQWLPLAGAGLALIGARLLRPASGRTLLGVAGFVALAATLLAADLFRANMGFNPAVPVAHAEQPVTGSIRYLERRRPNRFAGFDRIAGQPLQADLAMRYGLFDARGYDYPVERRYDTFWRTTVGPDTTIIPPTTRAQATPASLHALGLLSVSELLQDPRDAPVRLPGLTLVYDGPDARVYHNAAAVPRAILVDRQRTVKSADAALAAVNEQSFDARRVAITERALPGLAQAGGAPTSRAGSASLVRYGDQHAEVRTRARKSSLLVLTDVHYPGWKATVDGREQPIERVDYLLRGVQLPAGAHTVEFRYEPRSWRIAWIVSSAALAVLAATALYGLHHLRRRTGDRRA